MNERIKRGYFRGRWPDSLVPEGEPLWLFYEVDRAADAVIRTVEVYPDGRITRNSIELEERNGDSCPSLIEGSLDFLIPNVDEIAREAFEELWSKGVDTPFWFVR